MYGVILFHQTITALTFPVAKVGLAQLDPYVYAFFRFSISCVIYLPVLIKLGVFRKIQLKIHLRTLIIGMILIPFNQVLFLHGQSMTAASHSSLLFATIPIHIYIMAIIFLKEKATVRRTAGILIAAAGVYLILHQGDVKFGSETLKGDFLVLIAVFAWAVATIMVKPLATIYGAFKITGMALVYGSLLYLPFGFYQARAFDYSAVTHVGWLSVIYMGVVVSVLAYVLWYWLLKYLEASRLAIAQNLQPIIASTVAAIFLAEPIGPKFVIGGMIVLSGVILTEIRTNS